MMKFCFFHSKLRKQRFAKNLIGKCQIFPRPPSTPPLSTLIIVYTGPLPAWDTSGAKSFLRGGQMF